MAELKFTRDHECIYVEGELAWVGITKYAREALGDLVFVELPEIGKLLVKAMMSPLSNPLKQPQKSTPL